MTPDEKQQLSKARDLIKSKQYDEARRILQGMPFNDTAQDWLLKLSQMKQTNTATANASSTANTNTNPPLWEDLKPWNPEWRIRGRSVILFSIVFSIPLVFFFAFNWRRLGKGEWFAETLLMGVLLIVVAAASFGMLLADVLPHAWEIVPMVGSVIGLGVFTMSLSDLQTGAYHQYRNGGVQAMQTHIYDFQRPIWTGLALTIVLTALVGGIIVYASIPSEFENEFMRIEYPNKWTTLAADWSNSCKENPEIGCFLTLSQKSPNPNTALIIIFSSWTHDNPSESIQGNIERINNASSVEVLGQETIAISERTATVIKYINPADDPTIPPYRHYRVYVPLNGRVLVMNAWTNSEESYELMQGELSNLFQGITFK